LTIFVVKLRFKMSIASFCLHNHPGLLSGIHDNRGIQLSSANVRMFNRSIVLLFNCSIVRLFFFIILSCILSSPIFAQLDAGVNDTINPGVPVTLSAMYGLIGTGVTLSEDGVEGPFPIGFEFSFFGEKYTKFYIGANGWISFLPNPNAKGIREAFAVPSPKDFHPKACILGPFQDLNPLQAGSPYVFYQTVGQQPDRKLVVMWCQCPMYSCESTPVTFQIILNETTNIVENHIYSKPNCSNWFGNKATQGVQNETGYVGFAVPGNSGVPVPSRNATSWSVSPNKPEAWKYTPTSADSFYIDTLKYHLIPVTPGEKITYRWYQDSEQIAETQSVVVAPKETTTYVAWVQVCDGEIFTDTVTIFVIPYIPNAFTPNGDGLNDKFLILGLPPENITRFNLQIFNRWGQVVFTTNNILEGWDGRVREELCPEGVYTWLIYYEDNKKTKTSNKGTITLIRN